jgi:hypothetical protein
MNNKILNYLSDNEYKNITFQKYIVECLLNIYTDIYTTEDIRNKYHELTGKYTDLNNTHISKIKNKIRGGKINKNLEDILNNICKIDSNLNLEILRKDYIDENSEKIVFISY